MDAYQILGLPQTLIVEGAQVDDAWREATRQYSQDQCGSEGDHDGARDLNEARALLSDPVRRLEHWLSLNGVERARAGALPSPLIDCFTRVGKVLAEADHHLQQYRQSTSAIARATLVRAGIAHQLAVQEILQGVQGTKRELLERFPAIELSVAQGEVEEATQVLNELKFLQRWEKQCMERLVALIALE